MKILIAVAIIVGIITQCIFIVDERDLALRFKFGEIVQTDYAPGLYFKWPMPINNVLKMPDRILTSDNQPERFLTGETKFVLVDFFIKWKIIDAAQFYRSFRGLEDTAHARLVEIVTDGMKDEFSRRTIPEVVSAERSELMDRMLIASQQVAQQFGVDIIDVRVKRIDLPDEVSGSVYDRMRQERARTAKKLRAEGEETSERIQAEAERERTVIVAEAYRDAERIRGEGDARAAEIYANAYNKNQEFYSFHRSMQAYRRSLGAGNDILVLEPDSEFFQYLNDSGIKP
ncbi:MAG: protease modulator HflC [Gammaproteobacteria bacterium]|nr:protease modulator HflC [Gammaproteobacteria bacterium]